MAGAETFKPLIDESVARLFARHETGMRAVSFDPAGEQPISGVDAEMLVDGIRQYGQKKIHLVNQVQDVAPFLERRVKEGDLVITLGAGDVHRAGRDLLQRLAGETD